jgi:hypothetical protein
VTGESTVKISKVGVGELERCSSEFGMGLEGIVATEIQGAVWRGKGEVCSAGTVIYRMAHVK